MTCSDVRTVMWTLIMGMFLIAHWVCITPSTRLISVWGEYLVRAICTWRTVILLSRMNPSYVANLLANLSDLSKEFACL